MYLIAVFLLWNINSVCSQSQCGNYTNLTGPALRTDNSRLTPVQIPVGWYRYTGTDAGIMATSCPNGNNQCGAKQQVWIKGVFPALRNGSVTVDTCVRTVITDGSANCCERQNQLRIENCGLFYIYFLVRLPPETHVCFNNTAISLTTTSTPTSLPTSTTTTSTPTSLPTSRTTTSTSTSLPTSTTTTSTSTSLPTSTTTTSTSTPTTTTTKSTQKTITTTKPSTATPTMTTSIPKSGTTTTTHQTTTIGLRTTEVSTHLSKEPPTSNTYLGTTNEHRILTPGTTVMTNTNLNVNVSGKSGFKTELGAYIGGAVILTVIAIVLLFVGIRKYITSRQERVNNFDANAHQDERNVESNYQDVRGILKSRDKMIPLRRFNPRSLYESSCASSQ